MISSGDIKYLAGLWEGEGAFLLVKPCTPVMSLCMTDKDVIERAARVMGYRPIVYTRPRLSGHKPTYQFRLSVSLSVQWMMTLYPLMGIRRRARIFQLLSLWQTTQLRGEMRRSCIRGHPYRIQANGRKRCPICERPKQLGRKSDGATGILRLVSE